MVSALWDEALFDYIPHNRQRIRKLGKNQGRKKMMDLRITQTHGDIIDRKTFNMSVLKCLDFDGTEYYTVFDPRYTDDYTGNEKQVRCDTIQDVHTLMTDIASDAIQEYTDWLQGY
jgi:hypothetical protein